MQVIFLRNTMAAYVTAFVCIIRVLCYITTAVKKLQGSNIGL
jgi:hypothetical protein